MEKVDSYFNLLLPGDVKIHQTPRLCSLYLYKESLPILLFLPAKTEWPLNQHFYKSINSLKSGFLGLLKELSLTNLIIF
jgi:hypothetical protein